MKISAHKASRIFHKTWISVTIGIISFCLWLALGQFLGVICVNYGILIKYLMLISAPMFILQVLFKRCPLTEIDRLTKKFPTLAYDANIYVSACRFAPYLLHKYGVKSTIIIIFSINFLVFVANFIVISLLVPGWLPF